MSYVIRDENGIMLMEVSNAHAARVIAKVKGEFRPYKVLGKKDVVCFETAEGCVINANENIKLFLWEKTRLIPVIE